MNLQTINQIIMKFRRINFLFISFLLLFSCGKKINGIVKDNFGNSISGVEIKVNGSGFQTTTSHNGSFNLDYAPGIINIAMNKTGYTTIERQLQITEKSNYPLGIVEMWKNPDSTGVYLVGQKKYLVASIIQFSQKNEIKNCLFYRKKITINKIPNNIKFEFAEVIKGENLNLAMYKMKDMFHIVIPDNNIVSIESKSNMSCNVNASFARFKQTRVTGDLIINEIPRRNSLYCIIPFYQERGFSVTNNFGICFKISNDSLFVAKSI